MQTANVGTDTASVLSGVDQTLAVASAKGGVGKSTVSVNLALALAAGGLRVGLLDADLYGPSIPLMLGVHREPAAGPDGRLLPVMHQGLALMSMGFLTERQAPVIWRGPLLAQALQQFLRQVDWGRLDLLLVDLPPGTGDIPLSLCQAVPLAGAVMVTTPQDVALQDVERGIALFDKVEVDILGIIENMSYYLCPHCQTRHEVFGHGGGRDAAARLGLPFLGELPLEAGIRRGGDEGQPVVVAAPASPAARCFADLAQVLLTQLRRDNQPG